MLLFIYLKKNFINFFFQFIAKLKPGQKCHTNEFLCRSGDQCILKGFVCDSENDCTDNSDELKCGKLIKRLLVNNN